MDCFSLLHTHFRFIISSTSAIFVEIFFSVRFALQVANTPCWSWKFCSQPYCATIKSTRIWRKTISNYKPTSYWSVRRASKYESSDENPWRQRLKHANRSYFHRINKHHSSNNRKQIQQINFSIFSTLSVSTTLHQRFFLFFWPKKRKHDSVSFFFSMAFKHSRLYIPYWLPHSHSSDKTKNWVKENPTKICSSVYVCWCDDDQINKKKTKQKKMKAKYKHMAVRVCEWCKPLTSHLAVKHNMNHLKHQTKRKFKLNGEDY